MSVNLNLDDLGSFDGVDTGLDAPHSPKSPGIPYYNPVGLTIGEISPQSSNRSIMSSSEGNAHVRNHTHSVHGVHMHKQENAKVPLLNQAVDRTNSCRQSYALGQADDSGFSMAELFLNKESRHRQSLNQNYQGLGALLEDVGLGLGSTTMARRPSNDGSTTSSTGRLGVGTTSTNAVADETQMEIDALTAAIDPTPWSEMEQAMETIQHSVTTTISRQQQGLDLSHPHHYNYYPYGRHYQLPIPEKPSSPTNNSQQNAPAASDPAVLEQAIATAAKLASVGAAPAAPKNGTIGATTESTNNNVSSTSPTDTAPAPYTKAQQQTTMVTTAPAPAQLYQRQRGADQPCQHANAHSASRASVLAAASKKTQYGFGGNHVITSVPAPPTRKAPTPTPNNKQISTKCPPPMPPLSVNTESSSTCGNSGAAYERKKQRAKDARVKLNDAIERLSIAMSLAGSQSKQRIHLLGSRISKTEQRPKSIQISDECAKLADQAKKWDRPSFVGTAASLVQALNSQCESLSRELICLQERLDATTGTTSGVPGSVPLPPVPEAEPGVKRYHTNDESTSTGSDFKRAKVEESQSSESPSRKEQATVSQDQRVIFGAVAKLLDPISLTRCPTVSRGWRDMGAFDDDELWFQLAIQRFGFFKVRQWTEQLEDGEMEGTSFTKKKLYRAMNAANVMPHFAQDGLVLLGDAKIPGRISGWVFLVERSNGETLRSVKREPSAEKVPGTGTYQSRPVVELQIVIQNTSIAQHPIVIKNQHMSVDVSTRRSGGELNEISWDERFSKVVKTLDGSSIRGKDGAQSRFDVQGELCRLELFQCAVINVHIDARGCSTTSKFRQKGNFTKILVSLEGTTVPMVIPFLRDGSQGT